MNQLVNKFLSGKPVELTEASAEVVELRRILEGDCVLFDDDGNEFDVGGDVYWDERKSTAVYVPR